MSNRKIIFFLLFSFAISVIPQALAFAPYSPDYKKACDLIKKDKLQEAADLLAPIAADTAYVLSDYAAYKLAKILQQSGNIEEAKKEYLALAQAYPESILKEKAYYNLGMIYMAEKDYWGAAKTFVALIQAKPFNVPLEEARRQAGLAYKRLGLAMTQEASADSLFERAAFLLEKKDYYRAAASYEKFLRVYSNDQRSAEAVLKLGICYYKSKKYNEATGLFEKVKDYFPEAYYYMGFASWKQGNSVKAFECFNKLSAGYPESELAADAKYWMGKHYDSEGSPEVADGIFREIAEAFPKSESADDAIWEMGFGSYKKGRYKEAYSILGEAYDKNQAQDSVPKCLFWQAKSAEKLGWTDAADKIYLKTAERFPYTYYGYRALEKLNMALPAVDVSGIEPKQEIVIDNPHFDKYKELYAMGFYDDAVNEANAIEKQEKSAEGKRKAKICSAKAIAGKKKWADSMVLEMVFVSLHALSRRCGILIQRARPRPRRPDIDIVDVPPERMLKELRSGRISDPYRYRVTLSQSLILALGDESRWAMSTRGSVQARAVNYLAFILLEALSAVSGERVRMIR